MKTNDLKSLHVHFFDLTATRECSRSLRDNVPLGVSKITRPFPSSHYKAVAPFENLDYI